MENQMVHAIPFGKRRKTWALISGNAVSLLSDLGKLFNGRSPTTSNFIVLFLYTRFPPGWFV